MLNELRHARNYIITKKAAGEEEGGRRRGPSIKHHLLCADIHHVQGFHRGLPLSSATLARAQWTTTCEFPRANIRVASITMNFPPLNPFDALFFASRWPSFVVVVVVLFSLFFCSIPSSSRRWQKQRFLACHQQDKNNR